MKSNWTAAWVLLLALVLAGCAGPGGGGSIGGPQPSPCSLDEIRPGDLITVSFSDLPKEGGLPEQRIRVQEDGTITLPMGVSLVAGAKKYGVVEKEIVSRYVPKYYRQLSVSLKTEERFYFVGGQVKGPGRQIYLGPTTLLRAIQSCGDFTDFANKSKVQIHRASGKLEIIDCKKAIKDPKFDVPICPGDSIIVPQRHV